MSHLVIEGPLLNQMRAANESLEVRDSLGELIGIFMPIGKRQVVNSDEEAFRRFDMERAKRTIELEQGHGRSLGEIVKELVAKESQG